MLLLILAVIWNNLKSCRWPCSGLVLCNNISVSLPNAQVVQVRCFYSRPRWFSHHGSILVTHLSVVQPFSVFIFLRVCFGLVLAFWLVLWEFPARFFLFLLIAIQQYLYHRRLKGLVLCNHSFSSKHLLEVLSALPHSLNPSTAVRLHNALL